MAGKLHEISNDASSIKANIIRVKVNRKCTLNNGDRVRKLFNLKKKRPF